MLRVRPRRDLKWLRHHARRDRRIAIAVLIGVPPAWARQLYPAGAMPGSGVLGAISLFLLGASALAWLVSAYFLLSTFPLPTFPLPTGKARREPVEALRWVSRISRGKEWAFVSLYAYVAWHLLQFVTALLAG
jgi:hypothetical protein